MVSAFVQAFSSPVRSRWCDLPAAQAQTSNATLQGTVTDSSGGVLPGVTVRLQAPATGLHARRRHQRRRRVRFNFLPSGEYEITAELTGFKTVRQS